MDQAALVQAVVIGVMIHGSSSSTAALCIEVASPVHIGNHQDDVLSKAQKARQGKTHAKNAMSRKTEMRKMRMMMKSKYVCRYLSSILLLKRRV